MSYILNINNCVAVYNLIKPKQTKWPKKNSSTKPTGVKNLPAFKHTPDLCMPQDI